MELTNEQEAALLQQYEGFICNTVKDVLLRSGSTRSSDMEDLIQEARIAFLMHLRRMDEGTAITACQLDILHAMFEYWRKMFAVNIPHNNFKKERKNVSTVELTKDILKCLRFPDDDVIFAAEYREFLSG